MPTPNQPELTSLIREGRTFAVHRGFMPDGRRVVCKYVASKTQASAARARLENEFRITRQLRHPYHSRAIDLLESDHGPMLIFPDDGLTSLDLLGPGEMTPEDVRVIAGKVGAALADLHDQGIIHRDVKPSNIVASAPEPALITSADLVHASKTNNISNTFTKSTTLYIFIFSSYSFCPIIALYL